MMRYLKLCLNRGNLLNKGEGLTKIDLAKQMLLMLRESVTCRLWVAMDRWYLCKDFFAFLEKHQFDWVT